LWSKLNLREKLDGSKIQSINLISTDPNIRNGRPCVAGTSIEVSVIVIAKIVQDLEFVI
jgi:uncharacterized protein (DUF433 family)